MSYDLQFTDQSLKDIQRIKQSGNKPLYKKLVALLDELVDHPETGTGKPELLRYYALPTWSRRISQEHRLIYRIHESTVSVIILSTWGHYDDK
ncbi:Txe/YoeB family addiction module toxin [Dyadobacter sp. CY356]|uniref:Txe/YoeB family addiction module toxin n=1 Tax=Dyadobacter sp. CY356 TaxID=2906442 RepID=UPI001F41F0C2|nr:Txe/YoeB family addiction module toxin [Dyadobacter sp. CY356]MCF0059179.1 Txe/YoeB family addiction module toxin [Dyadobacter sp. CY356]